jgi:hypothetical protein
MLTIAQLFKQSTEIGSSTEFVGEKWTSWGFAPDPRILEALQNK